MPQIVKVLRRESFGRMKCWKSQFKLFPIFHWKRSSLIVSKVKMGNNIIHYIFFQGQFFYSNKTKITNFPAFKLHTYLKIMKFLAYFLPQKIACCKGNKKLVVTPF